VTVAFLMFGCFGCGAIATGNPLTVPSIPAEYTGTGTKEPICRGCWDKRQADRRDRGLPEEPLARDAYGSCALEQLP
jgi:hypothetical protein